MSSVRVGAAGGSVHQYVREFRHKARRTLSLVRHDIDAQRKETFLGLVWIVLWPLIQAGGFLIAFNLIRGGSTNLETILYTYIGVLIWTTASTVFISSLTILRSNREMITQIIFSYDILCLIDVTVKYLFFVIQVCIAVVVWLIVVPNDQWYLVLVYLPIYLIAFYMVLLATAWLASPLGVVAPDLSLFMPSVLMLLMVLSPIFQRDVESMPWLIRVLNELNPLAQWTNSFYAMIDVSKAGPVPPMLFLVFSIIAFAGVRYMIGAIYREIAKVI